MELLETILLGIIQGATEFLPISSSGHLVLFQRFSSGFSENELFLDIMLHLGTLAAVLVFCRREVVMILKALTHFFRESRDENEKREKSLFLAVAAASIPTAIIGYLIKATLVPEFSNIFLLACTFAVTTLFLIADRTLKERKGELNMRVGFIVGIVQGLAVVPGISRSGTTIVTGRALGLGRMQAARFAFVMSVPAIFGATILTLFDGVSVANLNTSLIFALACGMIAAAIVGYLSLVLLAKIIEKAKFSYFAFYTGSVSIFCLIWGMFFS